LPASSQAVHLLAELLIIVYNNSSSKTTKKYQSGMYKPTNPGQTTTIIGSPPLILRKIR
jgi:hypothetical protein